LAEPVYIRSAALHCALGDSLPAIVARAARSTVPALLVALDIPGQSETRPFCRIAGRCDAGEDRLALELTAATARRALADARISPAQAACMPLLVGSGSLTIPRIEEQYRRAQAEGQRYQLRRPFACGALAAELAERLASRAATLTFTTACTASANALIHGADLVAGGAAEAVLVVGVEPFSRSVFLGFEALGLLTADACRPLDARRDGIVLGEACSAIVLARRPTADRRAWRLLSGATGCELTSPTSNAPDGERIAAVIHEALERAGGLPAAAVDAIKIHGTGSIPNDQAECAGLKRVFGAAMPLLTGLKPFLGHTLGACGTSELALLTAAADAGFIPATPGFERPDPALGLTPLRRPAPWKGGRVLACFFGFGGSCAAMLLEQREV
jgi:3-oxoacyl-(acyl-carrier-protein) synthase